MKISIEKSLFTFRAVTAFFVLIVLGLINAGCSERNADSAQSTEDGFPINQICSLPQQVAPNSSFSNLGGGTWGKWNDSKNSETNFGCNGGKDTIYLKKDGSIQISVDFGITGGAEAAHEIGADYLVVSNAASMGSEKELRQQFGEFCTKLSARLFGVELPNNFTTRLLDEETYSPFGTKNKYVEQVGNGFVTLSSNNGKPPGGVLLKLSFFANKEEYEKYK